MSKSVYSSLQLKSILRDHLFIIIPARNEEHTIGILIKKIQRAVTSNIIVVDNGSLDETAQIVKKLDVYLVSEQRPGYGSACLAGINYLNNIQPQPKFVLFFDADGQANIMDIPKIAIPVIKGQVVYCHGSRMILNQAKRNLTHPARLANAFFAQLLSKIWKQPITDLGPLRCLKVKFLNELQMKSTGYGWTIEMTSKLLKQNSKILEVPVRYNLRKGGQSKISGNISTALRAVVVMGIIFLWILFLWKLKPSRST